jgi:putative sigma-54 modulation protein
MKFEFTGRHIEVTPALRQHVESHFERIAHLFDGKPAKAHVIIEVERGRHRSEIVINWRNEVLKAESSISDMYQSLSQSIDKIEKQARKLKDKVIDKSHKATKTAVVAAPAETAEKIASAPRIIESKRHTSKPITSEEAAMELDGTDQPFFIFRDARTSELSVIFRRKDGNYAIVHG